mgnify:CR=1 FL=1
MKTKLIILLFTGLLATAGLVRAQEDTNQIARLKEVMQLVKNLKYQQGEIELRGGLAKLTVPKDSSQPSTSLATSSTARREPCM